jgi:hypothetical protein
MTKKVLILSLNYSSTPAIALSGRINIAVNARGVFIADYGILEENITYLSDEWAPLTKVHIMAAIQALVDESTSLEEIYIYYAGYGSGIQIVKSIDWALMPETLPSDPLPSDPLPSDPLPSDPLPIDDSTITITIDELEPTTTEPPSEATSEPLSEATSEPIIETASEATSEPLSEATTEATSEPLSEATTESQVPYFIVPVPTEPIVPSFLFPLPTEPQVPLPTEPIVPLPTEPIVPLPTEPEVPLPTEPIVPLPTEPEVPLPTEPIVPLPIEKITEPPAPPPYKYDFYPMTQSYDKLTKQMVGSDYEIITNTEILDILKNTKCRTICVLDMCPFVDGMTNDSLTWGTDIIGNVNIISFAEPDFISSGKLATIQVITQHIRG